jgi:hypothetical protein
LTVLEERELFRAEASVLALAVHSYHRWEVAFVTAVARGAVLLMRCAGLTSRAVAFLTDVFLVGKITTRTRFHALEIKLVLVVLCLQRAVFHAFFLRDVLPDEPLVLTDALIRAKVAKTDLLPRTGVPDLHLTAARAAIAVELVAVVALLAADDEPVTAVGRADVGVCGLVLVLLRDQAHVLDELLLGAVPPFLDLAVLAAAVTADRVPIVALFSAGAEPVSTFGEAGVLGVRAAALAVIAGLYPAVGVAAAVLRAAIAVVALLLARADAVSALETADGLAALQALLGEALVPRLDPALGRAAVPVVAVAVVALLVADDVPVAAVGHAELLRVHLVEVLALVALVAAGPAARFAGRVALLAQAARLRVPEVRVGAGRVADVVQPPVVPVRAPQALVRLAPGARVAGLVALLTAVSEIAVEEPPVGALLEALVLMEDEKHRRSLQEPAQPEAGPVRSAGPEPPEHDARLERRRQDLGEEEPRLR